jgi:hypothetical protein
VSDKVLRVISIGEPAVLVRNLSFQEPDVQEKMGIGSLAAKVLCSKHNSQLSAFDVAGFSLVSGMDRIDCAAGKVEEEHETVQICGDDLERWILKTLCGGLFSGNLRGGSLKGVCPPREWLEVLFEKQRMLRGCGLYVRAGTPGIPFATDPSILKMDPVVSECDLVVGLRIWVINFEFVLLLAPLQLGVPRMLEYAQYRPGGIVVQGSNKRIQMTWQDGGARDELRVRWVGPG